MFTLVFVSAATQILCDEKIVVETSVNGKVARFAFDTGSERTAIFDGAAARLGVTWSPPPVLSRSNSGKIPFGQTEACDFLIGGRSSRFQFAVIQSPRDLDPGFDGVLSWNTIGARYILINGTKKTISVPSNDEVLNPKGWQTWRIVKDFPVLVVDTESDGAKESSVFIDTGRSDGVLLPRPRWEEWKTKHGSEESTLDASFVPGLGLRVNELYWANEIKIGDLSIRNVLVGCAPDEAVKTFPNFAGILGLNALRNLDFVIEGEENQILTRPSDQESLPLAYNRLGAVFLPRPDSGDDLIAQAVPGGPAFRVGVRSGDKLLRIDEVDVTQWRNDPDSRPGDRFWNQPAGKEFELQLEREGKAFRVKVMLEEIFPIKAGDNETE